MSDVLIPPLLDLAPLLGVTLLAGALTQLARRLATPDAPRLRPTLALSLAAGIAALTVTALLLGLGGESRAVSPAWLLAAACITGWSGPDILARLGHLIEQRLGLPATTATGTSTGTGTQIGAGTGRETGTGTPRESNVPQLPSAPADAPENGS